MTGQLRIEEI